MDKEGKEWSSSGGDDHNARIVLVAHCVLGLTDCQSIGGAAVPLVVEVVASFVGAGGKSAGSGWQGSFPHAIS